MKRNLLITILLPILLASFSNCYSQVSGLAAAGQNPYPSISAVPVPPGCVRVVSGGLSAVGPGVSVSGKSCFADWLRTVRLKRDKTVYLYNGSPKSNQRAQFAVLDISVGKEDLQQCADAVMRLRAEYQYFRGDFQSIRFCTGEGVWLNFRDWMQGIRCILRNGRLLSIRTGQSCADRRCFDDYLRTVFSYCGTLSLEKQLVPVKNPQNMQIGDVWVHGGAPGHAMLVIDMAVGAGGKKYFLLAQGYMPAQDIHIVVNPTNQLISPWFELGDGPVYTPEWVFYPSELRGWEN